MGDNCSTLRGHKLVKMAKNGAGGGGVGPAIGFHVYAHSETKAGRDCVLRIFGEKSGTPKLAMIRAPKGNKKPQK